MQTLQSVLKTHLTEHGCKVQRDHGRLSFVMHRPAGVWDVHIYFNEDDRWLACRSLLPCRIPETLRRKAAELIAHMNYGKILGSFELDMSDGEVAYKTSLRLTEDELTDTMLSDLLGTNFDTFETCLPAFLALVYGKRSLSYCLHLLRPEPAETEPPAPEVDSEPPGLPPGQRREADEA